MRPTSHNALRIAAARRRNGEEALTLLELMVSISLMLVIVYGLFTMFDRTQEAMRSGFRQVDVLESQRASIELTARELEQAKITGEIGGTNLLVYPNPLANNLIQGMPASLPNLTNELQSFFFLTRESDWKGVGYHVIPMSTNISDIILFTNWGIGSLSRFETSTNYLRFGSNNLLDIFLTDPNAQFARVSDNIVHLRLYPYNSNGARIYSTNWYAFTNKELPSYIDMEIGTIEPHIVEQARSFGVNAYPLFLSNQVGRVHYARQRIPIHTGTR